MQHPEYLYHYTTLDFVPNPSDTGRSAAMTAIMTS